MQKDFHYYATYCAAIIAGFSHEESMDICYADQFTDYCSKTYLSKLKAPTIAATTQLTMELANAKTDLIGLQDITRIWSSFHFLPRDLYSKEVKASKRYLNKYRLICGPNGTLLKDTVELAKNKSMQAIGLAMHILSDTWAHRYFAGTPSLVINNTNNEFYEILDVDGVEKEVKIKFKHSMGSPDNLDNSEYSNSIYQIGENSIMNLGHGRAGHLPDYSFIKYKYLPAWNDYNYIIKDNPSDYMHAFEQMVYALQYLHGDIDTFEVNQYASEPIEEYRQEILDIINKRQIDACLDWKKLGEKLSGKEIEDFDIEKYQDEYVNTLKEEKDNTFLGKYILAALRQKSMVTNRIYKSGNILAGISINFEEKGFKGIKAFFKLIEHKEEENLDDKPSEN